MKSIKSDYLEGISLVKHFLDDIIFLSREEYDEIDFSFYDDKYEKLLFYISKSLLSENFDELFANIDVRQAKATFNNKLEEVNLGIPLSSASKYMIDHQYCKMPKRFSDDPILAYKFIIRNSISHYEYKLKEDRVVIDRMFFEENLPVYAEFSVATLMALLRNTLSSFGSSNKKGAYHYYRFLNPQVGKSCYFKIVNLEDNIVSPADVAKAFAYREKIYGRSPSASSYRKYLDEIAKITGRYYIKREDFDKCIMEKAGISSIDTVEDYFLYMCAYDGAMRSGIVYDTLIDLVFSLRDKTIKDRFDFFSRFYPILNNSIFILYMSLVFDDLFTKDFNGTINSGLFIEKSELEDKDIPRKFRNSLAHSRYYFENIFDSSEGIIIEFWDEKNGIKNFECKITKKNAETLINQYLSQIS